MTNSETKVGSTELMLQKWMSQGYTASFLSERPLNHEVEVVLRLLASGLDWSQVRHEVFEKNLFQLRRTSTAETYLKLVRRRIAWLDSSLQALFLTGERNDKSAILLYTFLASYRLPREFVLEELRHQWCLGQLSVSTEQIECFFERKKEQHPDIALWATTSQEKGRQVIARLLAGYSLLVPDTSGWRIEPIVMSEDLEHYVRSTSNYRHFLQLVLIE
jgi:hypothetical protein